MSDARKTLEAWFRRVWEEQDETVIEEMFLSQEEISGQGGQLVRGPKEFKQLQAALCNLMSDISVTIDSSIEQGPWISALCTLRATSKAGQAVCITGNVSNRIESGKIVEAYNHWDFLKLWTQLGLLPQDSLQQGLAGNKVV